jgi:hypothetical protein
MRRTILTLLGAARLLTAQPNVANGDIQGAVTDPAGAAVPGATVTLKSEHTGLVRTAPTGLDGEFRLLVIPPGEYDVQIESKGLRPALIRGVRVSVGEITLLDAQLELSVQEERIDVAGTPQLLDVRRSHQANTLTDHIIGNLPIDRRDYLTFTLLAPGVADSTAIADNTDLRVKATPHSGISFFGSNGRGNSVMVDGGEANDGGGGVRSTLTQEAVEEFQINRSNYSAELGGASGGAINIVSKGGTNEAHGAVFGFFRHQGLDAGNPFARVLENGRLRRTKPPGKRQQFGGVGGRPDSQGPHLCLRRVRGIGAPRVLRGLDSYRYVDIRHHARTEGGDRRFAGGRGRGAARGAHHTAKHTGSVRAELGRVPLYDGRLALLRAARSPRGHPRSLLFPAQLLGSFRKQRQPRIAGWRVAGHRGEPVRPHDGRGLDARFQSAPGQRGARAMELPRL